MDLAILPSSTVLCLRNAKTSGLSNLFPEFRVRYMNEC